MHIYISLYTHTYTYIYMLNIIIKTKTSSPREIRRSRSPDRSAYQSITFMSSSVSCLKSIRGRDSLSYDEFASTDSSSAVNRKENYFKAFPPSTCIVLACTLRRSLWKKKKERRDTWRLPKVMLRFRPYADFWFPLISEVRIASRSPEQIFYLDYDV